MAAEDMTPTTTTMTTTTTTTMEAAWRRTIFRRTAGRPAAPDRSACPPGDIGAGASHHLRVAAATKAQASYDCCSSGPGDLGVGRVACRCCSADANLVVVVVVVVFAHVLEIVYIMYNMHATTNTHYIFVVIYVVMTYIIVCVVVDSILYSNVVVYLVYSIRQYSIVIII